jgi:hypothetical protein
MKYRWFELVRSMNLSSLPQNKLEEILEITAPTTLGSAIGADYNSLSRMSQGQTLNEYVDRGVTEIYESEESDYEIFDY